MLASPRVDETAEWCHSFIIVPKPNITMCLCPGPARLNQVLIWPAYRGPTLNHILPKLTNACYMTIIDASSGYHNLKHDKKSSLLTTFLCQLGRYRLTRLPFGVAPAGDMFQRKIKEIFKSLLNVFGIAGGILIIGYDCRDHDRTPRHVMQIWH